MSVANIRLANRFKLMKYHYFGKFSSDTVASSIMNTVLYHPMGALGLNIKLQRRSCSCHGNQGDALLHKHDLL